MMKISLVCVLLYVCHGNLVNSVSYGGTALPAFKISSNARVEDPSEIVSITEPTTRDECAELCINQVGFLCHAFDYDTDTYTCKVLNSPNYPTKITAGADGVEHWDLTRMPVVSIQASDCQEEKDEIEELKYQRAGLYIACVVFAAVGVVIILMMAQAVHIITQREVELRTHFGLSLTDPFLEELKPILADELKKKTDENDVIEEIQHVDEVDTPEVEGATGGIDNVSFKSE